MRNNKFSSAVFTALTIASGAIGLNALSAMTPLTQSAQAAYYANCQFTVTTYQTTNIRPDPNTYKAPIGSFPAGRTLVISTFVDGQSILDTGLTPPAYDTKWFKLRDQAGYVASAVVKGYPPTSPCSGWKLPWRSANSVKVNGGWHNDGFNGTSNAVDFGVPAGTPVLAPVNATVEHFCNAGNNHLGIKFKTDDGKYFAIAHVRSTTVTKGKRFTQGQQIGVVASDTPWNACAQSTGVHLHVGLPSKNMQIDGYTFSPTVIPSSVTSKNN